MVATDNLPAESRASRALARHSLRQAVNLSVAVAGTLGGGLLLATNLAVLLTTPVLSVPWIPLSANVALLFGGVMFAREYRRGR